MRHVRPVNTPDAVLRADPARRALLLRLRMRLRMWAVAKTLTAQAGVGIIAWSRACARLRDRSAGTCW